ncbi:MAG TPA: glycoside hydrolase family 2 TIM barrel-domain containing protein, partial [Longimicrobiales bacterium]
SCTLAVALLLAGIGLSAQQPSVYGPAAGEARARYDLNSGWLYLEQNPRDPAALAGYAAAAWKPVTLPHTWNATDVVDLVPGYRRDGSWYRRELTVGDTAGVRYLLHFDGANTTTDVYVNGRRAGGHVGGYIGFDVDLTPYLVPGGANRLDVRVDNVYDVHVIPSQKSDFAIDGGITRDVFLEVVPATRIALLHVRTPRVSAAAGTVLLQVELASFAPGGTPADYALVAEIRDERGRVLASRSLPARTVTGARTLEVPALTVSKPRLWSPASPMLYTATVRLMKGGRTGRPVDELSDRFGFRWYEFGERGPFYLNGERLQLRGTQWHEDYAGLGAALPDSLRVRDMAAIKAMGANFVRLAHYPHDPAVYRAADSLGLLLWDELPWCRGGVGDSLWQANTTRLLAEQIRQNFNHPSIILWSVGNEVDWVPDFPGGGDTARVNAMIRTLSDEAHRLDPGRLTSLRKYPGAIGIVDVFSPSIWSGWYSGVYKDYQKALEATRKQAPRFLHMEWGGDSHFGRHTENPISGEGLVKAGDGATWEESANQTRVKNVAQSGDWSESYIVDLTDWYLTTQEKLDWFAGGAQWIFKDFPTPLRPENPIPYMNQKGLLTRAGMPKDAYYVFKAHWAKEPFAYIESHTWTERAGKPGQPRMVRVWSNCDAVELFLDGASLGVKVRVPGDFPAMGLRWNVQFRPGDNRLRAACTSPGPAAGVAAGSGRPPAAAPVSGPEAGAGATPGARTLTGDSMIVHYSTTAPGTPGGFRLTSRTLPNGHLLIEATAVDAGGRPCLDYQ